MRGKVIVGRTDTTVDIPAGTELVDASRQFYTVPYTKVRSLSRFTRFMLRVFPWWPWGRRVEIEAIREDRLAARLRHKHPENQ